MQKKSLNITLVNQIATYQVLMTYVMATKDRYRLKYLVNMPGIGLTMKQVSMAI